MTFSTVDNSGTNGAGIAFSPQGDITYTPADGQQMLINPTTKTASITSDNTLRLTETLNLPSGAGGSDIHHGIWYKQTQTDLTGWDSVYLMYLEGGTNKVFSVDNNAELACPSLTINNVTEDIQPVLIVGLGFA